MACGMLSVHYRNALRFLLALTKIFRQILSVLLMTLMSMAFITYAGSHACVLSLPSF